jgi:cyclophilin family peptidyl-prolyl cis-trans isomerase/HEAT repeat protein
MPRYVPATILTAAILGLGACASLPPGPGPAVPLSYEEKMVALLRLEDQRVLRLPESDQPPPIVTAPGAPVPTPPPDLLTLLRDDEARLRRRAAVAVGRVGLAEGIAPLVVVLESDPEPDVRKMAAFALGLIGDPAGAEALVAALATEDPRVQGRAAEALGLIGHRPAGEAIAAMMQAHIAAGALDGILPDDLGHPKTPDVEAVRLGAYALVRIGDYDAMARALLDASGRPVSHWWPVAYAFQRVGHPAAAPVLLSLLESEGQITRAFAARGLGGLEDARASAPLLAVVADERAPFAVRVQAIRALAAMGEPRAEEALVAVVAGRDTPSPLRLEATTALGRVGSAAIVDLLLDLLTERAPAMRAAALDALARIDPDMFLAALSGLPPDAHFSVRAALARALAHLPAEAATPRLEILAEDEDQRVVPAALRALAEVGATGAAERLLAALEASDPVVRMAAAEGLATLGPPGAVPALSAAFEAAAGEGTYVARAGILAALVALDPADAPSRLRRVLAEDRDWAMRVRAAELLREREPDAEVSAMRPAPWRTPPDEGALAAMVSPEYSPQAYIETDKGTVQIELAVLDAPWTVANFITLAGRGYFDGVALHRVVPDFVVQDGDPRGDGEGGPGYTIRDELNERPYLRGTVGMALDWKDTGGSQFFITHSPQPHLDARYTVFGHVVAGMDVVDALEPWDLIRQVRVWTGAEWIGPP